MGPTFSPTLSPRGIGLWPPPLPSPSRVPNRIQVPPSHRRCRPPSLPSPPAWPPPPPPLPLATAVAHLRCRRPACLNPKWKFHPQFNVDLKVPLLYMWINPKGAKTSPHTENKQILAALQWWIRPTYKEGAHLTSFLLHYFFPKIERDLGSIHWSWRDRGAWAP